MEEKSKLMEALDELYPNAEKVTIEMCASDDIVGFIRDMEEWEKWSKEEIKRSKVRYK